MDLGSNNFYCRFVNTAIFQLTPERHFAFLGAVSFDPALRSTASIATMRRDMFQGILRWGNDTR